MINELVSVVVLSYNSEKFIKQTLESIITQTYKNFEIIVADDASNDRTIEVAKKYFEKINFSNYKISVNDKNCGIPYNCNRGIQCCNGKYVKLIAADDILINDCIENNIKFMNKNKNKVQFSKVINFYEKNGEFIEFKSMNKVPKNINYITADEQFDEMIYYNFIPAPTVFFDREVFELYGLFNEKYKLIEDYPMWIKILYNREKIYFIDEFTILYRRHEESLSNSPKEFINLNMYKNYKEFINTECKEYLLNRKKYLQFYHKKIELLKNDIIIKKGNLRGKVESRVKLINLIDPLWIVNNIKKIIK